MKKTIVIALGLIILLAACDRKAFVKKIVGNWKLDRYLFSGLDKTVYFDTTFHSRNVVSKYTVLFSGLDKTVYFDTTFREWNLQIAEGQVYSKSWKNYYFSPDSVILVDTLGYDTPNMVYIINMDTLRFIDTTVVPHVEVGTWELINSEEDLQLRNDSSNAVEIYRILELDKNNLKVRKGNEEFYYGK